jgi:hypothetical protein
MFVEVQCRLPSPPMPPQIRSSMPPSRRQLLTSTPPLPQLLSSTPPLPQLLSSTPPLSQLLSSTPPPAQMWSGVTQQHVQQQSATTASAKTFWKDQLPLADKGKLFSCSGAAIHKCPRGSTPLEIEPRHSCYKSNIVLCLRPLAASVKMLSQIPGYPRV